MRNAWLYILTLLAVLTLAQSAFASVVINEVLFNPSALTNPGDTGLEKIELYNNGSSAENLSGWELYPDGIGYFVFPQNFTIAAKSFVTIHLRLSGTNDASNLYHAAATGNMSDSSGSVALFSASGHPDGSIVDFVRYHKPGSSEKKTWESAAVKANLWSAGQFVDITALASGNSIALSTDGARGGPSSWSIAASPTIGSSNSAGIPAQPVNEEQQSQQPEQGSLGDESSQAADAGRPIPPSLKAYAGEDRTVVQGALVEFRGRADGINGEPLASARFSWNFGDGATREGKIVLHTYYFPGNYNVSLNVSSGEYTGADYLKITVVRPDLFITEAKSGERGFIEIYNSTDYRLDLGGFYLEDGGAKFTIERDTYVEPKSAVVFSNAVTGLLYRPRSISFRDAHGFAVDAADFSSPLLIEESFERLSLAGKEFIKTKSPNPGNYSWSSRTAETVRQTVEGKNESRESRDGGPEKDAAQNSVPASEASAGAGLSAERAINETAGVSASSGFSSMWFLAASFVIGIIAAAGFLFFRLH